MRSADSGRHTRYLEVTEIRERSHEDYPLRSRTPAQALREALTIDVLSEIIPAEEEADQPVPAAA